MRYRTWNCVGSIVLVLLLVLCSLSAKAEDRADCNAIDELLKTEPGRAVAACTRLAEKGDTIGQYNLALMYFGSQGVPLNYALAARWFRKAAEKGDAPAQYSLGLIYQYGRGVRRDSVEAVMWFRKAATLGNENAQSALGFIYGTGEGVATDVVEAYLWLSLAAAEGDDDAAGYRDDMARDMTSVQLQKAKHLVSEWRPTGAEDSLPGY